MPFQSEPTYYLKDILSSLQGAWQRLRNAAVDLPSSEVRDRLLFHIDEAMSWECVRNLDCMRHAFLVVANIVQREVPSDDVAAWTEGVRDILNEVLQCFHRGECMGNE